MSTPRTCFYVDESMHTPNGYVPAIVTEGEPGYQPLIGRDESAEPWYWGNDINTARRLCEEANHQQGISADAAREIVRSSMAASWVNHA